MKRLTFSRFKIQDWWEILNHFHPCLYLWHQPHLESLSETGTGTALTALSSPPPQAPQCQSPAPAAARHHSNAGGSAAGHWPLPHQMWLTWFETLGPPGTNTLTITVCCQHKKIQRNTEREKKINQHEQQQQNSLSWAQQLHDDKHFFPTF